MNIRETQADKMAQGKHARKRFETVRRKTNEHILN